ncbi:MAG: SusC/RagA family TonB-linked outer membrane protein [Bacteroidetes bacterium]|nr:SusC/RagA family TonB-linked outer membrane protein [Bacteroidota bacterium]
MKKYSFLVTISIVGFMLFWSFSVSAQKATLSGTIFDEKNQQMIGVSVSLKGTTTGSISDINGKYTIANLDAGKYTIVAYMIGYTKIEKEIELTAGQKKEQDFTFKEDVLQLNQVVVVGYGVREKRDITGSIETIKAKELVQNSGSSSVEQVMQGRASGVQVTSANGVAGAAVKINIRGTSSISAGSEPLYVIDGIPISSGDFSSGALGAKTNALSDLNPNDIESLEILKDASSAAIYGSRGANGVVIITTKKGKEGKTKFEASISSGIVKETNRLKLISATEQLELRDNARAELGLTPESKATKIYGNWTRGQADSLAALGGTDWIDQVLQPGNQKQASISASGGNEKTIFYIGGTYLKEKGFLVGNNYEKVSGRVNIENKATEKLKLGANIGISFTNNQRVPIGDAGGLGDAQRMFPYIPVYNSDGTFFYPTKQGYPSNPVWELNTKTYTVKTFRTISNIFADYTISKNLKYRSEFGLDVMNQNEDQFEFRNVQDPTSNSSAWNRKVNSVGWTTNNFFSYEKTINKIHEFVATLGNSIEKSSTNGVGLNGWNFPSDFFTTPNAADASNKTGYYYETGYAFVSNFFRLNYKLKNKYIIAFSIRDDGSSRFGKDNRYGWFPAASAGWIASDEKFLSDSKWLSYLKLRASYGYTGNANIGDFAYLGVYYPGTGYAGSTGIAPGTLPNPDLSWEKSQQLDLTMDWGVLKNKISGTLTYYFKRTSDMLLNVSIPTSSGFSSILKNVGKMNNHGYEFTITTKNLSGKLKWTTDFNIAFNRNKVIDIAGLPADAFESGEPGEGRVLIDYPVGQAYVVKYAGVQQNDGAINLYDLQGNVTGTKVVKAGQDLYYDKFGNLMTSDNANFYENRVPCGSPIPKFLGGITNTFTFKNFEFNFLFCFVYGNTIYDDPAKQQIGAWDKIAQRPEILNSWTTENTNTDIPALNLYKPTNSDRFLYDASYIRLRSVSLSYKFSEKVCKKLNLTTFKIFVSGTNLLTFTKYPGWDPEVLRNVDPNSQQGNISFAGPSLQTPQAKTVTGGISFTF